MCPLTGAWYPILLQDSLRVLLDFDSVKDNPFSSLVDDNMVRIREYIGFKSCFLNLE